MTPLCYRKGKPGIVALSDNNSTIHLLFDVLWHIDQPKPIEHCIDVGHAPNIAESFGTVHNSAYLMYLAKCQPNGTPRQAFTVLPSVDEQFKESPTAKGYAPGYTVSEWPYDLLVDKIYYSRQLFPCTYYYDPDNAAIPIALNLNIYGTQRLPTIKDDNEFCKYILDFAESLRHPGKEKLLSYLLAQDDGLRSELLAEYIRCSAHPLISGPFPVILHNYRLWRRRL